MNNRIEYLVEEFFNKFFPDLADKVHQEQSDWLRTALLSHEEKVVARVREDVSKLRKELWLDYHNAQKRIHAPTQPRLL